MTPRDRRLRKEYNLTEAEYEVILGHQRGCCAICRKVATKSLHVDHDHASGLVRGLLCWPCNKAIAAFRDDVTLLTSAVAYLTSPPVSDALGQPRYTLPGRIGTKKRAKLLAKVASLKVSDYGLRK